MLMRLRVLLSCCSCLAVFGGSALAEPPSATDSIPPHLTRLDDREVIERLAFIEPQLDSGSGYASLWWNGWTGFYATGVVVQSTRAGLTNDSAKRADLVVSAVKATGGVLHLLYSPLQAKDGADVIRAMPSLTRDDRLRQLMRAEEQLRINEEAADNRFSWIPHLANVGVNAAGALIVGEGFGDRSRGWQSAGIGIAVGEAMIWSQPWWPAEERDKYEQRFNKVSGSRVSWHIAPTLGGAAVYGTF